MSINNATIDLGQVRLFEGLSGDVLEAVSTAGQTSSVKKNQTVFEQGHESDGVLVVLQGFAKVTLLQEDGQEMLISLVGPGELIGELAAIDPAPRSATVTAVTPMNTLRFSNERFNALADQHPQILRRIVIDLAVRLRSANTRASDMQFLDLRGRLNNCLQRLITVFGQEMASTGATDEAPILINHKISQVDLGQMCNGSREQVNRILSAMIDEGLLARLDNKILVKRPSALATDPLE